MTKQTVQISTLIQMPEEDFRLTEEAHWIMEAYIENNLQEDLSFKSYGYIRTKKYLLNTRYAVSVKNDKDTTKYWENYSIFETEADIDKVDNLLTEAVEQIYEFLRPKTKYVHISSYTKRR